VSEIKDDYVEQVMSGMMKLHDQLFPPDRMDRYEKQAQEDIAAGLNLCEKCKTVTMSRLYPASKGGWICKKCSDVLFQAGMLGNGRMVFDMTKPEGV
jgi:hypothetical protein